MRTTHTGQLRRGFPTGEPCGLFTDLFFYQLLVLISSAVCLLLFSIFSAQKNLFSLQDSEKMLRERLTEEKHRSLTLEKMASIQKQKSLPKVNGGYSALDERPAHLVRKYGELYSQLRLETLDSLDKLPPLVNSDELKIKLLFSVVVVSILHTILKN